MPNPKRPRIQEEAIKGAGGNIHLRQPMKAKEQIRLFKKGAKFLRQK